MSKRLFDTIRRLLGRGLTQREVDAINASLRPDAPSEPEKNMTPGKVGPEGVALIHEFEQCQRLRPDGLYEAYPDPGSVNGLPWTIGWGSTGPGITKGTVWAKHECDDRFEADMVKYADAVKRALGTALDATSQRQFDALVSFHYNTGAIKSATLTRLHIAGEFEKAALQFRKWIYNDGKPMKGLVRRRAAEEALYRKGSK